jgi:hypothetical protein
MAIAAIQSIGRLTLYKLGPRDNKMPANLTTQHPPLPLDVLIELRAQIASGASLRPKLEDALRTLARTHPLLNYTWETGHTFWRGRTRAASERYPSLQEMLWPPPAYAKIGRSNLVGESILYICDHLPTAVAELSDVNGCPMQFIALEIRPGETARFAPIGELAAIGTTGHSLVAKDDESINMLLGVLGACPADDAQRLILADQLIFEAFSLPGRHDIASMIAHEIRNKVPDLDGVMYGSTKKAGAINIAMRPTSCESKCQIVAGLAADLCRVEEGGKCKIDGIEPVAAVDDSGAFIWSEVRQSDTRIPAFKTPSLLYKLSVQRHVLSP